MKSCEICGNALINPRAKTCSTKCRTIKHRRDKSRPALTEQEASTLQWFNDCLPGAARPLNELLSKHGKEALLLAYAAMNEYANFCETEARKSFAAEKAS